MDRNKGVAMIVILDVLLVYFFVQKIPQLEFQTISLLLIILVDVSIVSLMYSKRYTEDFDRLFGSMDTKLDKLNKLDDLPYVLLALDKLATEIRKIPQAISNISISIPHTQEKHEEEKKVEKEENGKYKFRQSKDKDYYEMVKEMVGD